LKERLLRLSASVICDPSGASLTANQKQNVICLLPATVPVLFSLSTIVLWRCDMNLCAAKNLTSQFDLSNPI
jgi:hypothetical protein